MAEGNHQCGLEGADHWIADEAFCLDSLLLDERCMGVFGTSGSLMLIKIY